MTNYKGHFRKSLLGGFLVATTAFSAVNLVNIQALHAQAPAQAPQAMPVSVEVIEPKAVSLWNEFSGRITPVDVAIIRPQVSGKIMEIKFENGAHVKKGDVLFVIDPRTYDAAVKQAKAALASARNAYGLAVKESQRAKELIKSNAISKRVYDERTSAAMVAKAQVDVAQAALDAAQINLDYTNVVAPISGKVGRAEITVGNLVDMNAAPILTSVVAEDSVYADFDVDEKTYLQTIAGKPAEGKLSVPVKLSVPSLPDAEYEGVIQSFDNHIDPSSGTIRARAVFENKDQMLVPGMYVSVKMGSASDEKKILVPEKFINTDQSRKFVLVLEENGSAGYRPVTLGESSEGMRVITSGLNAGDKLITESIMNVRPGMPVVEKPKEEAAESSAAPAENKGEMPAEDTLKEAH